MKKTVLKEFAFSTKTNETVTYYRFKAIKYNKLVYLIRVHSQNYVKGILKSNNYNTLVFDNKESMINEYNYHYYLAKKNKFTDRIKVIK